MKVAPVLQQTPDLRKSLGIIPKTDTRSQIRLKISIIEPVWLQPIKHHWGLIYPKLAKVPTYMSGLYFRPMVTAISPHNMARNVVLT